MWRWLAGGLAIIWGLALAVTFALAIPYARAAQHLVDGARPLVQTSYLAHEQALIKEGRGAATELIGTALPRLAEKLGESPQDLRAQIASQYPDVEAGLKQIPAVLNTTGKSLANLQARHTDFLAADAFPVRGISRETASYGGIALGVVLALLGAATLATRQRWALIALCVVGVGGAVGPVVLRMPQKALSVRAVAHSLNISEAVAHKTRADFEMVQRFHDQLQGKLLSDAAAKAGTTPQQLSADIETGLTDLPASQSHYADVISSFRPDVELREAAFADFQKVKDVPVPALTWGFIVVSALLAICAGMAAWRFRPAP